MPKKKALAPLIKPKTPKDLAKLERQVAADYRFYSKQTQYQIVQLKKQQRDDLIKALETTGKNWLKASNRLSENLDDEELAPSDIASLVGSLEKVQNNIGVYLNVAMSESSLNKEREIEFKRQETVFKTAQLFKKYLQQAGLSIDVDSDVLEDVIVEAGSEMFAEDQSEDE